MCLKFLIVKYFYFHLSRANICKFLKRNESGQYKVVLELKFLSNFEYINTLMFFDGLWLVEQG